MWVCCRFLDPYHRVTLRYTRSLQPTNLRRQTSPWKQSPRALIAASVISPPKNSWGEKHSLYAVLVENGMRQDHFRCYVLLGENGKFGS